MSGLAPHQVRFLIGVMVRVGLIVVVAMLLLVYFGGVEHKANMVFGPERISENTYRFATYSNTYSDLDRAIKSFFRTNPNLQIVRRYPSVRFENGYMTISITVRIKPGLRKALARYTMASLFYYFRRIDTQERC